MAGPTITKRKIYYRKAEFTSKQNRTLQQLVGEALSKNSLVSERLEAIDPQAAHFRVIGRYHETESFLFGQLLTFQRGSHQQVLGEHLNAKTCALDAVLPPVIDDIQYQYQPGALYFVLFRNHAVVIQNTAVRITSLEQHLVWLLRTKNNILSNREGLILKDEPQPATKARIRKSHVKSVSLGRPFMNETVQLQASGGVQKNTITKFRPDIAILDLLKSVFADSDQFEKLGLEDSTYDSNLEVWIQIRFPKRQRSKPEDSMKLLDNLGIALRDIDEDQSKLILNDNSVVQGRDLKVFSDIEVSVNSKGMPDEAALFASMRSWLGTQIKNGTIAPD